MGRRTKTPASPLGDKLRVFAAAYAATGQKDRAEGGAGASVSYCEHCGTKLNGKYGMASTYGHVEYALEFESDSAHTEIRCREALKTRVASLESDMREIRTLAQDERIAAIRVVVSEALKR